jgi:GST-like protein
MKGIVGGQVGKPRLPESYVKPKVWDPKNNSAANAMGGMNRPSAEARHEGELPRGKHDLQLYSLGTPNGWKVAALLEELEADYDAYTIDIGAGDQFSTGFTKANPNQKIPVLLDYTQKDPDGGGPLRLFESGAILQYLAEKHGRFLPTDQAERAACLRWVFWGHGVAPYIGGMYGHFYNYAPIEIEYCIDRATCELKRIYDVLDRHLSDGREWVCGSQLTIADFQIAPWFATVPNGYAGSREFAGLDEYKHVTAYLARFVARPAVKRGRRVNGFGPDAIKERHDPSDFAAKL